MDDGELKLLYELKVKVESQDGAIKDLQQENKEIKEKLNKVDMTTNDINTNLRYIRESIDGLKNNMKDLDAKIESVNADSRINIMKDVIKPLFLSVIGGGSISGIFYYVLTKGN